MSEEYKRENRIGLALSIRGWKQVDLVERTGIPKNSINAWVNQKWQPKQKALMTMAKVLDVSEMWLAGYDVPMERSEAQIKTEKKIDELTQLIFEIKEDEDLKDLFTSICSLTDDQRTTIKSMVNELSKVNALH